MELSPKLIKWGFFGLPLWEQPSCNQIVTNRETVSEDIDIMEIVNDESSEDEPNLQPLALVSSTFHNPEDLVQFVINGLFAKGLKKGLFFAPDPYVKFKIGPGYADHNSVYLPHHGQNCRTIVVENTTEPIWAEQV